jgi:hypothetical protein
LGPSQIRRTGLLVAIPALALSAAAARGTGVFSYACALSTILLPVLAALLATGREPHGVNGAVAAGCCTVAVGLATFIGYVFVTYVTDGGTPTAQLLEEFHHSGARDYRTWIVGDNLGGAVFLLGFILVAGIAVSVIAAAVAKRETAGPTPN